MPSPLGPTTRLAALGLALGLAACGGRDTEPTGPDAPPLLPEEARFVTSLVMPSLLSSVRGLEGIGFSPDGPFGVAGAFDACPVVEPDPPTDTDGDFVPDRVTFRYGVPGCDLTGDEARTVFHGSVRLSDPDPRPGRDYVIEHLGFGVSRTILRTGATERTESDGTRRLRGDATVITLAEALDFLLATDPAYRLRIRTGWELEFTAAVPGSLDGLGLPAGTTVVTGEVEVEELGERRVLAVRTLAPLAHAVNCVALVGGTLGIRVEGRGGEVQVTFRACGEDAEVVVVPDPAPAASP